PVSQLSQAFWNVVQHELSPSQRRDLLLFITGLDRLPPPGVETLSIEAWKGTEGSAAIQRALCAIPTAHTCDNILELPNYWEALLRSEGIPTGVGATSEQIESQNEVQILLSLQLVRLKAIMKEKLLVAIANAGGGYGLDGMDGDDGTSILSSSGSRSLLSPFPSPCLSPSSAAASPLS
ncbi:unnamed protein product, partial [Choristocarpus tenellus]